MDEEEVFSLGDKAARMEKEIMRQVWGITRK
jgi:hypothetical protein